MKVFVDRTLTDRINRSVGWLRANGMNNFEIVKLNAQLETFSKYRIRGGGAKAVRWILGAEYFRGFDYAYIGDVDVMILPEHEALLETHKRQMDVLGLPFSNKVRTDSNGNSSNRLTGLHFVKVEEYFSRIGPIATRIWNDLQFRDSFFDGLPRDESFLYKLVKTAFPEFDDAVLAKAVRPWHGIHLGITRGNSNINLTVIEENCSLTLAEIRDRLTGYSKDKVFRGIQNGVFVRELQVILHYLSVPYPLRWSVQGVWYSIRTSLVGMRGWAKSASR